MKSRYFSWFILYLVFRGSANEYDMRRNTVKPSDTGFAGLDRGSFQPPMFVAALQLMTDPDWNSMHPSKFGC